MTRHAAVYAAKVANHSADAHRRQSVAAIAEPLLEGLGPGEHRFQPAEFRALAMFLLEGEQKRLERALQADRFKILELEIICERELTSDNTMTLSEFARMHGVPRVTLLDWADRLKLRSLRRGNRKLFHTEDLVRFLSDHKRKG